MKRRTLILLVASALPFLFFSVVAADGEVGLVVDFGDGEVETYCVAFEGDSIRGDELLESAGVAIRSVGGLVCALDGAGCPGATDTRGCLCQCQGSRCTYWAYFTQGYGGSWIYSSLGFTGQAARDGDMQAWKWGTGGPSSAPAPAAITFEEVCGHSPRGGAVSRPVGTPSPTVDPSSAAEDGGGVPTAVFVFAIIAMTLVLAIAGIIFRRRGIGSR